jgi:hypothetical protein
MMVDASKDVVWLDRGWDGNLPLVKELLDGPVRRCGFREEVDVGYTLRGGVLTNYLRFYFLKPGDTLEHFIWNPAKWHVVYGFSDGLDGCKYPALRRRGRMLRYVCFSPENRRLLVPGKLDKPVRLGVVSWGSVAWSDKCLREFSEAEARARIAEVTAAGEAEERIRQVKVFATFQVQQTMHLIRKFRERRDGANDVFKVSFSFVDKF